MTSCARNVLMRVGRHGLPCLLLALATHAIGTSILASESQAADGAAADPPSFEKEIAPLLASRCVECHGGKAMEASLDLRSKAGIVKGGDSGAALVPGSADRSLLFEKIKSAEMPPEDQPKLADSEVALIKRWIETGAHGGESIVPPQDETADLSEPVPTFQPLRAPAIPAVATAQRVKNLIDAFLLAKLEAKQLVFSPPADKSALLRRVSLDLIGLPPSPDEAATFLADQEPGAYERLVDRLLGSPHFGERWGRHWLDAAGYVDVYGSDNDASILKLGKGKWRYRDYVIRAMNEDKPYDRFLTEQLAGDELVDWRAAPKFTPEILQLLTATAFLATAADNTDEKELRTAAEMHDILQRTGEVIASNLLGLTLRCAKCHNHKYEPISQRDYYSFLALLAPAYNPQAWKSPLERALPDVCGPDKAEIEAHNAKIDACVAQLEADGTKLQAPYRERLFALKLAGLPKSIQQDVKAAIEMPEQKRGPVERYLVSKFQQDVRVRDAEVAAALSETDLKAVAETQRQIAEHKTRRREWGLIHGVYDVGPPPPTHVLKRGNLQTPGAEVPATFLAVLSGAGAPADVRPTGATSGRRLALAATLTDWKSPAGGLVARVMVNRVWQHLLGRGIIETTDNLGRSGAKPTHPELLEWLTCQFVAHDARLKPLIRQIVASAAYQQSSATELSPHFAQAYAADPENHLLWRMPLRRLEAEIVRDAVLATSGKLDLTMFGPAVPVEARSDGRVSIDTAKLTSPTAQFRRSIYLLTRRNYHLSILGVFDQPFMATNCPLRCPSTVVLQPLTMLNDSFVVEQAGAFARRIEGLAGAQASAARHIELAFQSALARGPDAEETALSMRLLERQRNHYRSLGKNSDEAGHEALVQLCHMLLNTSEFLYIP